MFFLLQHGEIVALIVSAKRKGSALVEFKTKEAAVSISKLPNIVYNCEVELPYITLCQIFSNEKV
jgi:hypothetical protein